MKSLNLGILAHVDAGKTSLTERLLCHVGVLEQPGSVDAGNTHTDSLELEQQRGITIQSSVVSFQINQTRINLIDTPGHADFISEVERALAVIDAVVLVISAVEGIQAQTRLLMNTLKRLKKPVLIFVNKIDRTGAHSLALIEQINQSLQIVALPMVRVDAIGTKKASVSHLTTKDRDYYRELMDALISQSDTFLEKCIHNDLSITKSDFLDQIILQTRHANFYPVYFGSAVTGVGIDALCIGIEHCLPSKQHNYEAACEGMVFKIEYDSKQLPMAYINLTSGQLKHRESIKLYRQIYGENKSITEKISNLKAFQQGKLEKAETVYAGSIACISGFNDIKIGDSLSEAGNKSAEQYFSRPTIATEIISLDPKDSGKLFSQLKLYATQDPLIELHQNASDGSLIVKLYGEIQQQIIRDRLLCDTGITVKFKQPTMICIERPIKMGEAKHIMDLHNLPLDFYATLGFRIEPGAIGSGVQYDMQAHRGRIPTGYHSVIEQAVYKFLESGLHGWQVTDCLITMTDSGICPLSIAPHFRQLTPILLQQALEQAQTQICEPISYFEIDIPSSVLNNVLEELANWRARIEAIEPNADNYSIKGKVLSSAMHTIQENLPHITQGRANLISHHEGYSQND